jgi:DNA invertase Pin-like site-specific DNA recombinase
MLIWWLFQYVILKHNSIMKIRYVRVSHQSQNPERQKIKKTSDEELYVDVCSGSIPFNKREAGMKLLCDILIKDITQISVSSVDRLGRNAFDIQKTVNHFNEHKINLKIDNLGIESILPDGKPNLIFKMIIDVLSNVAAMEREALLERQKEGIAIAKAAGKYSQKRNKLTASDTDILSKYKEVAKELKLGVNSLRKVATLNDVSLGTVQKVKAAMDRIEETKKGND